MCNKDFKLSYEPMQRNMFWDDEVLERDNENVGEESKKYSNQRELGLDEQRELFS